MLRGDELAGDERRTGARALPLVGEIRPHQQVAGQQLPARHVRMEMRVRHQVLRRGGGGEARQREQERKDRADREFREQRVDRGPRQPDSCHRPRSSNFAAPIPHHSPRSRLSHGSHGSHPLHRVHPLAPAGNTRASYPSQAEKRYPRGHGGQLPGHQGYIAGDSRGNSGGHIAGDSGRHIPADCGGHIAGDSGGHIPADCGGHIAGKLTWRLRDPAETRYVSPRRVQGTELLRAPREDRRVSSLAPSR